MATDEEYDTKKSNRVVVLLDEGELGTLDFMAKDLGLSNSSYVRQLILNQYREKYLNRDKK